MIKYGPHHSFTAEPYTKDMYKLIIESNVLIALQKTQSYVSDTEPEWYKKNNHHKNIPI